MAQGFEARTASADVQDTFLNIARRSRAVVGILLMDGSQLEARVTSFDRFALIVEHDGGETMVFKHAIASIRAPRSGGAAAAATEA